MAEYLIQEETLTGIADKIRILSGTEGAMTTAEMQSDLETFNADMGTVVTAQDDLITQITTALDGKAAVSLPTLTNPASAENIESGYQAIDGDGNLVTGALCLSDVQLVETDIALSISTIITQTGYGSRPLINTATINSGTMVSGKPYILIRPDINVGKVMMGIAWHNSGATARFILQNYETTADYSVEDISNLAVYELVF